MIRGCRVGTVIIDELHDIQREYLSGKVVEFLRFIKNLINETGRPFVVAGTSIILDLIGSEEQMAGRLNTVVQLKPFTLNEFVKTFLAFERMLPLRLASNFRENESVIQFAYTHSQGFIGRLSYLLQDACQVAIETGEERITLSVLEKVKDRSIEALGRRS
jgi:predicted AAA+ superfamily ATPase